MPAVHRDLRFALAEHTPTDPGGRVLASSIRARIVLGLLALGLVELGARAVVPPPGMWRVLGPSTTTGLLYAPIPGGATDFRGWSSQLQPSRITIDALGSRQALPGDPGCRKVWVVGDSVAFGWGVSDHEAWPALLADRAADVLGCRPEVRNLAVPGYQLEQDLIRVRAEPGLPDRILLHADPSDGEPAYNYTRPVPLPRAWIVHSRAMTLLARSVIVRHDTESNRALEAGETISTYLQRWDEWVRWAAQSGRSVEVLVEPDVPRVVKTAMSSSGLTTIDLTECNRPGDHFPQDRHYTPQGHRCVADHLVARWRQSRPGRWSERTESGPPAPQPVLAAAHQPPEAEHPEGPGEPMEEPAPE